MKILKLVFIISFLIGLDQITKYAIRLSGGFYICNPNLAFSLRLLHIPIIILALIIIFFLIGKIRNYKFQITNSGQITKTKPERFGICNLLGAWNLRFGILLVLSGAISNTTDRIIHGCVTDFIDLKFWPVFNLADSYITIGSAVIIYKILIKKHK